MRRLAFIVLAAAAGPLVAACGPPVTAAVGIGYDDSGRLIAVVKVCDDSVEQVSLQSYSPDAVIGFWRRDAPLTGLEQWAVDDERAGSWTWSGEAAPVLNPKVRFALWIEGPQQVNAGSLSFVGVDLEKLRFGQVLVRRHDRDRSSTTTSSNRVIDLQDMASEDCSY